MPWGLARCFLSTEDTLTDNVTHASHTKARKQTTNTILECYQEKVFVADILKSRCCEYMFDLILHGG